MSFLINEDVNATAHIKFLAGSYALGRWNIPYFVATLPMSEAARDLRLTREMPGASVIDWKISDLYQREIDWRRVENQIFQYLRNADQPQFFNALTIALMPYSMQGRKLLNDFTDGKWAAPKLKGQDEGRFAKVLPVGPIAFGFYDEWDSLSDEGFQMGVMRWNPDQIHAVAIDGQHRLAAIKKYVQSVPDANARVPVIFLVFDERLGFKMQGRESVTSVLRDVFIDLNKHAEKVQRARQILLDDRDPVSRCVRALIADQLSDSLDSVYESPFELPLSLIDWHSEEAKFHEGPYLCSVLQADWIVSRVLGTKSISDSTDYEAIGKQLTALKGALGLNVDEIRDRLDQNVEAQVPFSYGKKELDDIEEAFQRAWNRQIVYLLTRYRPYADLIDVRETNSSISRNWQLWYQLHYAAQKGGAHEKSELDSFLDELQNGEQPISAKSLAEKLANVQSFKGDSLAFKVVFQKAYIEAALEFLKFKQQQVEDLDLWISDGEAVFEDLDDESPEESDEEDTDSEALDDEIEDSLEVQDESASWLVDEFIASINEVDACLPEFLSLDLQSGSMDDPARKFWLGSLLKAEGAIDFTQGAAKRAKDLVFLAACLGYLSRREGGSEIEFDDVYAELRDPGNSAFWKRAAMADKRLWVKETSTGGRILSVLDKDFSEAASAKQIESRLAFLWDKLRS